jgi:hypothetical protein
MKASEIPFSVPRGAYDELENYVLNPNQFGVKGNLTKNLMRYHSPKGTNMIERTEALMH